MHNRQDSRCRSDGREKPKLKTTGEKLVGLAAIAGPLLHMVSDILEWYSNGFSSPQLYINLLGFLPLPFVILGLYWLRRRRLEVLGFAGAVLYAAAFVYFTYSTVFSIYYKVPTYEDLWHRLGWIYTLHGGFMVGGGLMFAVAAFRGKAFGKIVLVPFTIGLLINLIVALLPVPEILQIGGSMFRNFGLIGMGIEPLMESGPDDRGTPSAMS